MRIGGADWREREKNRPTIFPKSADPPERPFLAYAKPGPHSSNSFLALRFPPSGHHLLNFRDPFLSGSGNPSSKRFGLDFEDLGEGGQNVVTEKGYFPFFQVADRLPNGRQQAPQGTPCVKPARQ